MFAVVIHHFAFLCAIRDGMPAAKLLWVTFFALPAKKNA